MVASHVFKHSMDVFDMEPLHPELIIKEEKMCVISDVMGETEFFGQNEYQELASIAEGTIKVEAKEEIQDVKDEVKSEITEDDHQDVFGPWTNTLLRGFSPRANYTDRSTTTCRRS